MPARSRRSVFCRIPTPEEVPLVVSDPYNPRWSYAGTKLVGEQLVIHYAKAHGIPSVIVRPHNFYGPRAGYDHVIPEMIGRMLAHETPFTIHGSLTRPGPFCLSIDDAVNAMIRLMEHASVEAPTVHIGSREETRIRDLAAMVCRIANWLPEQYLEKRSPIGSVQQSASRRVPRARADRVAGVDVARGRLTCDGGGVVSRAPGADDDRTGRAGVDLKRILVTGATGNIGPYLVTALRERWPDADIVRCGGRGTKHGTDHPGDLRDREFVSRAFSSYGHGSIEAVVHAAAAPYYLPHRGEPGAPFDLFVHDVDIAMNVLAAARHRGVGHVVFLSSATIYEKTRAALTEDAGNASETPEGAIGLSKWAIERALRAWSTQTGGTHTIWRLFNVVSPEESHGTAGHVIVDLYRRIFIDRAEHIDLIDGDRRRCFSSGRRRRECDDEVLADPRTHNQTFNLGGAEPASVADLAVALVLAGHDLDILPLSYMPSITGAGAIATCDDQSRLPSIDKAKQVLGWKPSTSFADCVDRFVSGKAVRAALADGKHA